MANIYISSGASFSAIINVTYPEGSICTVSNYKKTWTAPNTSGSWSCKVNEVGFYTVKIVDGSKKNVTQVIITTQNQVENVTLTYYLYNAGIFNPLYERQELKSNVTITYNSDNFNTTSVGGISYGFVVFKEVTISNNTQLNLYYTGNSPYSNGATIAVVDNIDNWVPTQGPTGTVAYTYSQVQDKGAQVISLSIASLDSTYDIAIGYSTQGGSWTNSRDIDYTRIVLI